MNNKTTKVTQSQLGISIASANPTEYPTGYADESWDIAQSGTELAELMGQTGSATQAEINEKVAETLSDLDTGVNAKYTKPASGIPESDLASDVQTSLGLADTALQAETDPVFTASPAHGITSTDIGNWNAKQDALSFDNTPTNGSDNPVKSGGVYTAIENEATSRSNADTTLQGNITAEATARANADALKVNIADVQDINSVAETMTSTTNPISAHSMAVMKAYVDAEVTQTIVTPVSGSVVADNSTIESTEISTDVHQFAVKSGVFATQTEVDDLSAIVDEKVGSGVTSTPTYSVTDGSYIDKDGVLSSNASFKKTSAFHVQKGGVVTFVGRANATMACIAKTDANESSYEALVIGQSNSVEHTYTYTATEDCYIVVSYYVVVSITATTVSLFTQLQEKVSGIEEDVAELGGDVQEVQETLGKDETYTPTYEVVSGSYVDSAGIVQSNASYKKTSAIKVAANSKVTFIGKANPTMACIAKTDANESSYEVLKLGVSNTADNTYTAEVAEGCYIVISYYTLTSLSIESKSAFSALNDRIDSVEEGMESLPDVEAKVDSIVIDSYYNIDSEHNNISFDNIVLSQNGDSFEVEVEPNVDNDGGAYAFTRSGSLSGIGLSISRSNIYVRLDDGTWAFRILGENPASGKFKVKVAYENDVMNLYIDNVLKGTYNGQSTLTLMRIGFVYNATYFWLGKLYSAAYTHNGVVTPLEKLQGFTLNDLSKTYEKEYTQAIEEISLSKIHVVPTADAVGVYFRIKDDLYGSLTIGHEVNTGTDETSESARNPNTDYWRLTGQGGIFKREGNTFTFQLKSLLVGAENEFAIAFAGMKTYAGSGDFTGGYHGNERIDLDSSCYVTFIVNGEEYTISELVALGEVDCDTFSYRELSELYTSYNYENLHTHTAFAKHLKVTEFGNFGYKTRNFVKLNLSGIGKSFLTINTAFTGLVCIHKDFAHKIIGDDGSVYYGQNPTTTTTLVPVLDYYTREMVASNAEYSCFIDSHYLGSDVDAFENPSIDVRVMDRANDNKYYSYLPSYAQANDGEFFATECEVKWFVNNNE